MEIECVVCGSPVDPRVQRCVVCGADLPPTQLDQLAQAAHLYHDPLHALSSAIKTPLSVGAMPLNAMMSQAPKILHESQVIPAVDSLLGPEDLAISSPPASSHEPSRGPSIPPPEEELEPSEDFSQVSEPEKKLSTWVGIPIPTQLSPPEDLSSHPHQTSSTISHSPKRRLSEQSPKPPKRKSLTEPELKQLEVDIQPDRWIGDPDESIAASPSSFGNNDHQQASPFVQGSSQSYVPTEHSAGDSLSSPSSPIPIPSAYSETAARITIPELGPAPIPNDPPSHPVTDHQDNFQLELPVERMAIDLGSTASTPSDIPSLSTEQAASLSIVSSPPVQHRPKKTMKGVFWFILAVLSMGAGIGGALLLKEYETVVPTAQLTVKAVQFEESHYRVQIQLKAEKGSKLVVPDSWVDEEQSPAISVDDSKEVTLSIPASQLQLGDNQLNAIWMFPPKDDGVLRSEPVQIPLTLSWQARDVQFEGGSGRVMLMMMIDKQSQLSRASLPYQPGTTAGEYAFILEKDELDQQLKGDGSINVRFTLTDASGSEHKHFTSFNLPEEITPFSIMSPVLRYARPEEQVSIVGQSSPRAIIYLTKLEAIDGSTSQPDSKPQPLLRTEADDLGYFSLDVPLPTDRKITKRGLQWTLHFEAIGPYQRPATTELVIKRSHKPTWEQYLRRLVRRRDRAVKKYRRVDAAKLKSAKGKLVGKPARIKGVVTWINRDHLSKTQLLLVNTCTEGDGCPVWVQDPNAFWVNLGQRVHVFGVVLENTSSISPDFQLLEAPTLRARLTTP